MSQRTLRLRAFVWLLVNVAVDARISRDCILRNLSVTADDYITRLYIDGQEVTGLVEAGLWTYPDQVKLPCTTRVIAIEANDTGGLGAMLAFTGDGYIKTNTSWKCTNVRVQGWQTVEFNDSTWKSAVVVTHDDSLETTTPTINRGDARWIWTQGYEGGDPIVFCRQRLDVNECLFGQPINECQPSMGRCKSHLAGGYSCSCYSGYESDGQHKCEDVDECLLGPTENKCNASSGNCVNTQGSYKCHCYQGFANVGDQQCEEGSSFLLILGVSLGVSLLVIVAFIVALLIRCSRTSASNNRGARIDNTDRKTDDAVGQPSANRAKASSPSEETYSHLKLKTLCSNQSDIYEQIIE